MDEGLKCNPQTQIFSYFLHLSHLRARVETLITEEALLLAKYLRDEKREWIARIIAN
jgi:hypothetical protein